MTQSYCIRQWRMLFWMKLGKVNCTIYSNTDVSTSSLGQTRILKHKILFTVDIPYRVSPAKLTVLKELVEEMLADDIIEPSSSAWASPVVLVPKKDGRKPRFCVNYIKLNAVTHTIPILYQPYRKFWTHLQDRLYFPPLTSKVDIGSA